MQLSRIYRLDHLLLAKHFAEIFEQTTFLLCREEEGDVFKLVLDTRRGENGSHATTSFGRKVIRCKKKKRKNADRYG